MTRNAEVVLDVFRAVEQRDRDALFALFHDEVEFHDAAALPYGGTTRGKETLRRQLDSEPEATWLGTWGPLQPTEADRRMDARVVSASGDEVVVLYRQRAVSPQGERFDSPVLGLYEVREGKFARAQMFHYDTASTIDFLARAAGGSPKVAA
jgi:ketosteroid isomerase-like protein